MFVSFPLPFLYPIASHSVSACQLIGADAFSEPTLSYISFSEINEDTAMYVLPHEMEHQF